MLTQQAPGPATCGDSQAVTHVGGEQGFAGGSYPLISEQPGPGSFHAHSAHPSGVFPEGSNSSSGRGTRCTKRSKIHVVECDDRKYL